MTTQDKQERQWAYYLLLEQLSAEYPKMSMMDLNKLAKKFKYDKELKVYS